MMAELLGLDGRRIDVAPDNSPLSLLKALVGDIEAGRIEIEKLYILMQCPSVRDRSMVQRLSRDTGLTAEEAVFWLEMHKTDILRVMFDD
jgi:hypothetical protein